jgi:F420H(2)-dependent biliverdin reductase
LTKTEARSSQSSKIPRQSLSTAETGFVARPLLGKLASVSRDGSPHLTPIWYVYENGKFFVSTPQNTVKARNVRRDGRVALLVDNGETYLMVKGYGTVSGGRSAELITEKLAIRYEGERSGRRKAVELLKKPHVMIEIIPGKVVSQGL